MNIAIDIRCLMDKNRTGVGEYTFGLLDAIFKIDKTNQFFLFYNSNKDIFVNLPKWEQENVHYIYTRWPNKWLNLLLCLELVKLDKLVSQKSKVKSQKSLKIVNCKLKIDIWFSPNLNFTNLSKHLKHIQTVHDLSFEFFPGCFTWKRRLWHWFLDPRKQCQKADMIITPSENTRRDVVASYKVESYKVIKLGPGTTKNNEQRTTNNEQVKQKYNLPDKYILFLGTLEPRKNVETLIEAYKIFCQKYPISNIQYSLIIAGAPGWKNKQLMQTIKNTPNVKYIGYVDNMDKPALYQNASLFVFPSLYEGFGLPVLEACGYGVPVITSNRSSLLEVGQNAVYYVNPYNVSELAGAIKLTLQDTNLRSKMIEKGLEVAKGFEWEKTAEKFLEIINKNG